MCMRRRGSEHRTSNAQHRTSREDSNETVARTAEPHIEPGAASKTIDLSKIDFEVMMRKFEKTPNKNIEAQQLRA